MFDITNVTALANAADCEAPATAQGAEFLRDIAQDAYDGEGDPHQIAEGAVYRLESTGTFWKWQVFVDLQAYREDVSGYGIVDDMDRLANAALYEIAQRLASAVLTQREMEDE